MRKRRVRTQLCSLAPVKVKPHMAPLREAPKGGQRRAVRAALQCRIPYLSHTLTLFPSLSYRNPRGKVRAPPAWSTGRPFALSTTEELTTSIRLGTQRPACCVIRKNIQPLQNSYYATCTKTRNRNRTHFGHFKKRTLRTYNGVICILCMRNAHFQ